MTRRYGRVTFEGWLLDVDGDTYLNTLREGFNASETGVLYSGLQATIEFLPEPVTFNDGDVVTGVDDLLRVRIAGRWVWADSGRPTVLDDDYYAVRVSRGSLFRVVPEQAS